MDSRLAQWRKSSHSSSGECVEVGSVQWRKSSWSNGGGECVEVGLAPEVVGVRDTKDRQGGMLAMTREAWSRFIGAVKDDKYRA
jgi:hypothetical protein